MPMPSLHAMIATAILSAPSALFSPYPASADGQSGAMKVRLVDEIRFGVLAGDLEPGGANDGRPTINAELLTPPLGGNHDSSVVGHLLHPRLHLGGTVSMDANGVDQAYAGFTWTYNVGERLFLETSFGGATHDGATGSNNPDSYGCALQFRESVSVGAELTHDVSIMATLDHMSNAGLCDGNQGLTNAGVRLGYRW